MYSSSFFSSWGLEDVLVPGFEKNYYKKRKEKKEKEEEKKAQSRIEMMKETHNKICNERRRESAVH